MKKILSVILALIMVVGLCACQGGEGGQTAASGGLQAGFGRANLTPSYSVPLSGYGNTLTRMSQGFLDYIYSTCIAVTDENDSTVLLITTDLIATNTNMVTPLRDSITAATGVPADRIMIQGTHTHSGPDLGQTEGNMVQYRQMYIDGITQSAVDAMADRSPATMETAKVETERMNFVRHYTVSDGTVYGDNFGSTSGGVIDGHTSDPDNVIQLILFKRAAEDKKDIIAVNFQGHPKMASTAETALGVAGRPMISSDYIGSTRDYVEKNSDLLFAYYLGASGNLNTFSKIVDENRTDDHRIYGQYLGEYVLEGVKNTQPVEGTAVKSVQRIYKAPIDKSEDHLYQDAMKIVEVWTASNNYSESLKAAPDSGIISPYHASSIVSRYNNKEGERPFELNAVCVGPIGFITAPYEMFDMNAMFVKENSPFETTFVMTVANGSNAYIAAEHAFEFNNGTGSYEVHNRTFPRGTAEALADNFVEMLNELKK